MPGTRTRAPAENKDTDRNAANLIRSGDCQNTKVSARTAVPRATTTASKTLAGVVKRLFFSDCGEPVKDSGPGADCVNTSCTVCFNCTNVSTSSALVFP